MERLLTLSRLRKFLKEREDLETEASDEELNLSEKQESELFGFPAIEAGYFGGVTQSRLTSAASLRANSPLETLHTRSSASSRHSSFSKDGSSPSATSNIPRGSKLERQSSADSIEVISTARRHSNLRIVSHAYEEGHQSEGSLPPKPPPAVRAIRGRLQPSYAELNGRLKHEASVNKSEQPRSLAGSTLQGSPNSSRNSLTSERKTSTESASEQSSSGVSPASSVSSTRQSVPAHYAPEPPHLALPEDIGTPIFEEENPASAIKSQRGSMTSSGGRSWNRQSMPLLLDASPIPSLLAFPGRAVIDSSNYKFTQFLKERV